MTNLQPATLLGSISDSVHIGALPSKPNSTVFSDISSSFVRWLLAAILMLVFTPILAVAQIKPLPPILCMEGDVSCNTNAPPPSGGIKWHPGHYMRLSDGDSQNSHFAQIDDIAKEPAIRGVALRVFWYEIESSKNVYEFSKIDAYLNKIKSVNAATRRPAGLPELRLVVNLHERRFNTTSQDGIVPNYLRTDPLFNGGLARTKNGYVARLWEQPVMDRLIEVWRAVSKRYDSDAYLEAITSGETTMGWNEMTPPESYSREKMHNEWRRLITAARAAAPHTNIVLNTNMLGDDPQMQATIEHLISERAAAGGPDILPREMLQAQRIWTGTVGGIDYRGKLPIVHSMDAAGLGGGQGDYSPLEVYEFAFNTLGVNYILWARNTWTGTDAQKWSTGILPVIRAHPALHTKCPTSYQSCARD